MFRTIHASLIVVWLTLTISIFCIGVPVGASDSVKAPERPHVLLICVDDLKPNIGCFGDRFAITPHIDRLAQRGVRFDAAYCNQAVCSPSRNSLMTGLRPQTIGIYDLPTHFRAGAPDAITVAEHFRKAGYQTQAMGKILHVGHGNHEDARSWSVPHWKPKSKSYRLPESMAKPRKSKNGMRGNATESADVPDDAYADGAIAGEAVRRIAAAAKNPEQPFFIAIGFLKPHLPFVAPRKYWDLYQRSAIELPQLSQAPKNAPSYAPSGWGELRQYADMPRKGALSEAQTRELIHGYYAATSYVDAQIGRVLDALDASGMSDKTIVVLWGDHGWHLGDHGMWCKHTNYEQAARIPLIVCAPGAKQAVATDNLVETVDLYPTLCEVARLPVPSGLDGTSFAATLNDPARHTGDHVIHVYPRGNRLGRAIRTDRYRLVEWKVPGADRSTAEYELYDYVRDPNESENLIEALPKVADQLRQILATHPEARPQVK